MLVKDWMNTDLVTVDPEDSIIHAAGLLKQHGIKMLPVMKNGDLLGVVTDRDLKHAMASNASTLEKHELRYLLDRVRVGEVMSRPPVTVPLDYTLEETAEILLQKKISGAPVVDHEAGLVGTIAQEDIFAALIALTGLSKRGVQFAVTIKNRPGSIKEVADVIRKYGGRLASILSTFEDLPDNERTVYIRMYGIDRRDLPRITEEIRRHGRLHYVVDLRENKREIYE
ncbi:MAG: CBS and ACT domain-containing protein [Thermodesulfobacteriota bacterium]